MPLPYRIFCEVFSMTLFVTSSPFLDGVSPAALRNANGFVDRIRGALPDHPNVVFVASDPKDHAGTCSFAAITTAAFADAGIAFSGYQVLDGPPFTEPTA